MDFSVMIKPRQRVDFAPSSPAMSSPTQEAGGAGGSGGRPPDEDGTQSLPADLFSSSSSYSKQENYEKVGEVVIRQRVKRLAYPPLGRSL